MKIILIMILGLLPPLLSLISLRKGGQTPRYRQARSTEGYPHRARSVLASANRDREVWGSTIEYYPGEGLGVGDLSCRFNAHSQILRCAVNPQGPCRTCPDYEPLPYLCELKL